MVVIYVQMAEIELQLEMSEDSDLESPVPKRMRQEFNEEEKRKEATVETMNGWTTEGGKTKCTVPACNGETFSRFTSFRKHWSLKHRRLVDVFACIDCDYKSADVWDVKKHMVAQHHRQEELWLKSQKMRNNRFIDPGLLNSPANPTKQLRREGRKPNGSDKESTTLDRNDKENTTRDGNTNEDDTIPAEIPTTTATEPSHSHLLVKATEAKRLKEQYAREETEFRTQYEKFEARKWYKLYCEERDQRRKAEEHIKHLESKLKKLENPKLLAIAKILES